MLRIDGIYVALLCSKAWFLADQAVAQANETAIPNSGDYGAFYDGDCGSGFNGVCFGKRSDNSDDQSFCGKYQSPIMIILTTLVQMILRLVNDARQRVVVKV